MIASFSGLRSPFLPFSSPADYNSNNNNKASWYPSRIRRRRRNLCFSLSHSPPPFPSSTTVAAATNMDGQERSEGEIPSMNLLFVEMGVGYDQHGQVITAAAMRACRDAITSNSVPA